jgi:hypothetical protein
MDEKIGNNTSTSAQHEKSTSLENFDNEIDNETKNKENVALKRTRG